MARNRDLDALVKALNAVPAAIKKKVEPAVEKGADEITSRARYLAPDDPATSGADDLRSNIKWQRTGVPMAARVFASVPGEFDHALAMEYGTSHHAAQPFFWPAYNTTKKRVTGRINRAITQGAKEAWNARS